MDGPSYDSVGEDALRRLVVASHPAVLRDPLLHPLSGSGHVDHVDHLTAFLEEVFGGPPRTEELGGFSRLAPHRGKRITEEQRRRFVELFLRAADVSGFPDDPRARAALHDYLEFGTEVAVQNSHAAGSQRGTAPVPGGPALGLVSPHRLVPPGHGRALRRLPRGPAPSYASALRGAPLAQPRDGRLRPRDHRARVARSAASPRTWIRPGRTARGIRLPTVIAGEQLAHRAS
ncbi:group II truncated hemoglobin [Motilibacter aurantiacus]|uniref:group II truncated hemoglobin n=1 Tax=Motilibacter aurantiacus TaxID=2714955 RepID=UPI0038B326BB